AVAGAIVAAVGEGWCFLINGLSYAGVIAALWTMRGTEDGDQHRSAGESAWVSVVEGFEFAWRMMPVRALLLLLGLVSLMGMPYSVLMPIFADQILHGGPSGLGFLGCASGLGALLGALSLAARSGVFGLGKWVAVSSAGFGVSLILF